MHYLLRSSLSFFALGAIAAVVSLSACQTHDRRIYSTHRDKNLHTPSPWAPSTSKAAEDATSGLGLPPDTAPIPPESTPATQPNPAAQ